MENFFNTFTFGFISGLGLICAIAAIISVGLIIWNIREFISSRLNKTSSDDEAQPQPFRYEEQSYEQMFSFNYQPPQTEDTRKTKIFNIVILDESGSMCSFRDAVVNGYNELLSTTRQKQIKYADEQQHLLALVPFNDNVRVAYFQDDIVHTANLNISDYRPYNNTAMYDAIGMSLTELKRYLEMLDNAVGVVTIISDGMENASRRFNLAHCVKLIEELKEMGCTFAFMGAQYADSEENRSTYAQQMAQTLHIDDFIPFAYSEEGVRDAFDRNTGAMGNYYDRMHNEYDQYKNLEREERRKHFRGSNQRHRFFEEN